MIVVGFLGGADELAVEIARRAAAAGAVTGARIEMVGAAAPGPSGDARFLELAAAGIGHATVIRSGADSLDSNDLELALRYLPDIRCVVLVRVPARLVPAALGAADWAGAQLVLVGPLDADATLALDGAADGAHDGAHDGALDSAPDSAPDNAPDSAFDASAAAPPIVLDPPPGADPDGTFAGFVAALAGRLDAGESPEAAFRGTVAALAVDPA